MRPIHETIYACEMITTRKRILIGKLHALYAVILVSNCWSGNCLYGFALKTAVALFCIYIDYYYCETVIYCYRVMLFIFILVIVIYSYFVTVIGYFYWYRKPSNIINNHASVTACWWRSIIVTIDMGITHTWLGYPYAGPFNGEVPTLCLLPRSDFISVLVLRE